VLPAKRALRVFGCVQRLFSHMPVGCRCRVWNSTPADPAWPLLSLLQLVLGGTMNGNHAPPPRLGDRTIRTWPPFSALLGPAAGCPTWAAAHGSTSGPCGSGCALGSAAAGAVLPLAATPVISCTQPARALPSWWCWLNSFNAEPLPAWPAPSGLCLSAYSLRPEQPLIFLDHAPLQQWIVISTSTR